MAGRGLIRPFTAADVGEVVGVWHRAGRRAYTYLPAWQRFSVEHARRVFTETILPRCEIWVASEAAEIVAFLAMRGSYIDRLYVDPPHQRRGRGRALVRFAKSLRPEGLELHTHAENHAARALYEAEAFVAVRFGVSPPPESAPDVEYHWRPAVLP